MPGVIAESIFKMPLALACVKSIASFEPDQTSNRQYQGNLYRASGEPWPKGACYFSQLGKYTDIETRRILGVEFRAFQLLPSFGNWLHTKHNAKWIKVGHVGQFDLDSGLIMYLKGCHWSDMRQHDAGVLRMFLEQRASPLMPLDEWVDVSQSIEFRNRFKYPSQILASVKRLWRGSGQTRRKPLVHLTCFRGWLAWAFSSPGLRSRHHFYSKGPIDMCTCVWNENYIYHSIF